MDTTPSFQDIKDAHNRIRSFINQTPVLTSNSLNAWVGAELFLKCEKLNPVPMLIYIKLSILYGNRILFK